jgi:hypothetical protein
MTNQNEIGASHFRVTCSDHRLPIVPLFFAIKFETGSFSQQTHMPVTLDSFPHIFSQISVWPEFARDGSSGSRKIQDTSSIAQTFLSGKPWWAILDSDTIFSIETRRSTSLLYCLRLGACPHWPLFQLWIVPFAFESFWGNDIRTEFTIGVISGLYFRPLSLKLISIPRIVERFSARFVRCKPGRGKCTDLFTGPSSAHRNDQVVLTFLRCLVTRSRHTEIRRSMARAYLTLRPMNHEMLQDLHQSI